MNRIHIYSDLRIPSEGTGVRGCHHFFKIGSGVKDRGATLLGDKKSFFMLLGDTFFKKMLLGDTWTFLFEQNTLVWNRTLPPKLSIYRSYF
jgi:hypothetical protein